MFCITNLSGTLMEEDEKIASFVIERGEVISVDVLQPLEKLPFEFHQFKSNEQAILSFLEDRVVPSTRIGLEEELHAAGMPYYDPTTLLKYNHGASVSDLYWIQLEGKTLSYADTRQAMKTHGWEAYNRL